MSIYSCFTGKDYPEIEKEFSGIGYGEFKTAVGEACAEVLAPVQTKYAELLADKAYLETVSYTHLLMILLWIYILQTFCIDIALIFAMCIKLDT